MTKYVLLIFILLSACEPSKPEVTDSRITSRFLVEGMHCEGCSASVKVVLQDMDGISDVTISHRDSLLTFTSFSAIDTIKLASALSEIGYILHVYPNNE